MLINSSVITPLCKDMKKRMANKLLHLKFALLAKN